MPALSWHTWLVYGVALLLAYSLKVHYSTAGSDELAWILSPTARLVAWLSGIDFIRESGAGYVNYQRGLIIAPACAGVNFLIAAWCMVIFSFLHRIKALRQQAAWFGGCAIATYLLTILTNAFRILIAVELYRWQVQLIWLTPERLHRLEGVVVYFGALCAYFRCLQRFSRFLFGRKNAGVQRKASGMLQSLLPALWYLLVILGIPIMRLASHMNPAHFIEHAGWALAGCAGVLMLRGIGSRLWHSL
jgi:exosortase K